MKTISLRYTDKFAPSNGTIGAHKEILNTKGFVWYGKMGSPISKNVLSMIMENQKPCFLLIHSGSIERYWMYIDCISYNRPSLNEFPSYYHDIADNFKTWFRVVRIENAIKNVMADCKVISSGSSLSEASRHSMSPYFIIEYDNGNQMNCGEQV